MLDLIGVDQGPSHSLHQSSTTPIALKVAQSDALVKSHAIVKQD